MSQMKPWTYSGLSGFESCPHKYYRLRVKKDVVEPPSEHATWGEAVHKAFENAVSKGEKMPFEMERFQPIADKLSALPGTKLCETKMAINRAFNIVDWWDPAAWSRGIADLLILDGDTASVIDYKTGKRRPTEQLQLYAGYVFAKYPEVERVDTAFVWVKDKTMDKETHLRKDVSKIWQPFVSRAARLEEAYEKDNWPCRPSGLCNGWCPVTDCTFCRCKK